MPGRNAEIVRDCLKLMNEGRVDEVLARLPDDVEWDARGSLAVRERFRGREAVGRAYEAFTGDWEKWKWEPEEIRELDDRAVLAVNRVFGRGRASGIEVSARGAQIWTFQDEVPVHVSMYQSPEEAARGYRRQLIERAHLYFVCEARPGGRDPGPLLDAALRGGAGIVQLREKSLPDDELIDAAAPFRRAAHEHGALFVLNDRPDLVAAAGAGGVHVGQDDMAVAEARRLAGAGAGAVVGLSTHSEDEVTAACEAEGDDRPDQISVGPVWETPTKAGRPGTGLGLVEFAAREATIPWFAIGGIDAETAAEVAAAGATRAVVVRAIRDSPHPEGTARTIAAALGAGARQTERS